MAVILSEAKDLLFYSGEKQVLRLLRDHSASGQASERRLHKSLTKLRAQRYGVVAPYTVLLAPKAAKEQQKS